MTEYDYSPEAYDRYLATQNRIANWVDKTEQHRAEFQSVVASGPQDLSRSGPVHPKYNPSPTPPRRQDSGQSQPRQPVIYPPPSESDSSDSYYEGPWPQQSTAMVLPQQRAFHPMQPPLSSPPPMTMPPTFMTSPHRVSHHHRHRLHDQRRSRSQHSPVHYSLCSPPLTPGYQYPYSTVTSGGNQGYVMMPQYSGTQVPVMPSSSQPPRSAIANVTTFSEPTTQPTGYFQPQFPTSAATDHLQPSPAFLASNSQPCSPQQGMAWSTPGAPSPAYPLVFGTVQSPPYIVGVPIYHPFVAQQPARPSYLGPPMAHQRVYDLSKHASGKQYYRRSVG